MTQDLYTEILKSDLNEMPTLNESDLFALKENYINFIIDGMDMDSLCQMAYDLLMDSYKDCNESDLKDEIVDLYDEETYDTLLEEIHG